MVLTNRAIGLSFSLALMIGIVTGVLASASACVFPDRCIVVTSNGIDWCSIAVGALMWPANQPELAQPIILNGKSPVGCQCFNSAENEIMWAQLPADTHAEFRAEIETAVRNECDFIVPVGWDHNCYSEDPDGLGFTDPYPQDEPGECIGACYVSGKNCDDPPNPYECEELYGEGGGETGGTGGPDPDGLDGVDRPVASLQEDV